MEACVEFRLVFTYISLRPMSRAVSGEIPDWWESQEATLLTYSVVHSLIHQQWIESSGGFSSGWSTRREPR